MNNATIEMLPIKSEHFFVQDAEVFYVETDSELEIIGVHMETESPLAFEGPKGIGKSLAFEKYAKINGLPVVQFDCSEGTRYQHLYGGFVMIGEEVYFKPGVLPLAYTIANELGSCLLVFEELNALTPQMQKLLCPATDFRRHVYVQEIGRRFECKSGNHLLIAATMNPSYYGGVSELNEDLRSRFSILNFKYPSPMQESEIIRCPDKEIEGKLIQLAKESRKGENKEELSYALSPRDLCNCVKMFNAYSENGKWSQEEALKFMLTTCVVGKYEGDSQKTIKGRIDSIFGINFGDME